MRITGTLHTIGDITTCEPNTDPRGPEYDFQHIKGIIITTDDDDALRAASNLLCATVDIYPHPVDPAVLGHCTPQNYAHALARLAHAEDHLAREVRSSQSLARSLEDAEALITAIKADMQARVDADAEEAHRRELAADAKSAAWVKYLDLRKQIRETPKDDDAAIRALVNDALTLSREHDLDPTVLELEEARRTIDALAGKQAEQERLMTAYRVQYHEADRALRKAEADLENFEEMKALLPQCTPPAMSIRETPEGWQATGDTTVSLHKTEKEAHAAAWTAFRDAQAKARDDDASADDFEGDDDAHEVMDKV